MCVEQHRAVSRATRGGRACGSGRRRTDAAARRSRVGVGAIPVSAVTVGSRSPASGTPAEGALLHAPGTASVRVVGLRSSVLTVVLLGQVQGTDPTPVAVDEVLGLLRRPLSARHLRRQALSGSTGGRAHAPGSLQRCPTRCTAVRGGRARAAVSGRHAPSREQQRCHRRQRADGVHPMTGHRLLLPNAWTVPHSSAPGSPSQRHRSAKKSSQPSPVRGRRPAARSSPRDTAGADAQGGARFAPHPRRRSSRPSTGSIRRRSHLRDQQLWRAEAGRPARRTHLDDDQAGEDRLAARHHDVRLGERLRNVLRDRIADTERTADGLAGSRPLRHDTWRTCSWTVRMGWDASPAPRCTGRHVGRRADQRPLERTGRDAPRRQPL